MKVLVVTTWFPGEHNQAEAPFNLDHVRALQHAGYAVRVIHVRLGRWDPLGGAETQVSATWEGLPVLRIALTPSRPLRAVLAQRTLFRELAWADMLHTMAFSSILAVMFPWLARRTIAREPVWVHTEHWTGALDPASVSSLWKRLAHLRMVYRLPHRITGVGSALAQAIRPFARPNAVSVVPCVVRCADDPPDAAFGSPLKLVAVGAVVARKRPEAAIATVAWLRSQGHPTELTWVGDGPLRKTCEAQIAGTDLEGHIHFAGAVTPEQVGAYLVDADLFLLPSAHETFFASAAEAIGAGRAVVISDLPGLGDFLTPDNSILVTGASPPELGRAVLKAVEHFAGVEAGQIAGPIHKNYSVEAVSALFVSVYREALARA